MTDKKMERKNFLLASLKVMLTEWCETSTSHGLPNMVRTNSVILKLMWAICFTVCTVYCVYSISLGLKDFLSYKTYITTEVVQDTSTLFPAVTICNLKATNKIKANKYLNNILYINGSPIFDPAKFGDNIEMFYMQQSYFILATMSGDKNLTEETKRALGYEMSDMLLYCGFNWIQCSADDFMHFFHPFYGNCFTFNNGISSNDSASEIKKVSVPGADYGLNLALFLGDPNIETEYEAADGMIVVVHNQSNLPLLNGDRILVANGFQTDLKINRNFVSKLGEPYSNCLKGTSKDSNFNSEYFDYIVNKMGMQYNQQFCYMLCLQSRVSSTCNCTIGALPASGNSKLCLSFVEIDCFIDVVRSFNHVNASDVCVQGCPLECDFIQYTISTSKSVYPTPYYSKMLARHSKINSSGISINDISKAVLKINVFYESLLYTLSEEVASMSTETFLSNIGGTLGLYLGISFLSFVEVVELFIILVQAIVKSAASQKISDFKFTKKDKNLNSIKPENQDKISVLSV